MIPIDYTITNFFLILFVCFLKITKIIFLVRAQLLLSGKPVSQYSSFSLIFSPLCSVINREQHEKYLYNQSSHYGKYRMFVIKVHASFINLKWVCRLIMIYQYVLFHF